MSAELIARPPASDDRRTEAAAFEDATYRKITLRIIPFLVLCYVVAFLDRSNIGLAKLQFTGTLGFSETVYGFGAGIFYLGYIACEIPSNVYFARIGVRRSLLRIMVLWGLCCAALGFMQTPAHYYALRLMLGAAEAGFFPGILLYITFWIPAARRARFTAIFMASIPIAGAIGGPLAGWIMTHFDGRLGLQGWQWLFIVEGLPAVLLGAIAYAYLDDGPAHSRWLTQREKALVLARLDSDAQVQGGQAHRSFGSALRDPRVYFLGMAALAVMVSSGAVFVWLPTIIRRTGIDGVLTIGLLSGIPFLVGIVVQFLVARHSDAARERRWHTALPMLVAALGWAILPLLAGQDVRLSLCALILATAGTFAAMGPLWTLPATFLSGGAAAGGIALITSIAGAGNFFSPILTGWLVDRTGSFAAGQIYFAGLLIVGAVFLLRGVTKAPATPPAL